MIQKKNDGMFGVIYIFASELLDVFNASKLFY